MGIDQQDADVDVPLPQDLTAPAEARRAARGILRRWRLPALLDPVLLTVSELVGNAVRHGRPPVQLRLRRSGQGVRVDVHDDASTEPTASEQAGDAEGGRGLFLVETVASDTGVEQVEDDGKVVWAQIDEPEPTGC